MFKKTLPLLLSLIMALALAACGVTVGSKGGSTPPANTSSGNSTANTQTPKTNSAGKKVTLDSMLQALLDAGFEAKMDDNASEVADRVGSFTFIYPQGANTSSKTVYEQRDQASVDKLVSTINKAGRNLAITNGVFITTTPLFQGVVEFEDEEVFLENLLYGLPLTRYEDVVNSNNSAPSGSSSAFDIKTPHVTPAEGWEATFGGYDKTGYDEATIRAQFSTKDNVSDTAETYAEKEKDNQRLTDAGAVFSEYTRYTLAGMDALDFTYHDVDFTYRFIFMADGAYYYRIQCAAWDKDWDILGPEFQAMIDSFELR